MRTFETLQHARNGTIRVKKIAPSKIFPPTKQEKALRQAVKRKLEKSKKKTKQAFQKSIKLNTKITSNEEFINATISNHSTPQYQPTAVKEDSLSY